VEVQCLAAPGASTFTISADTLANLPPSYLILDGSYANLFIGTLGWITRHVREWPGSERNSAQLKLAGSIGGPPMKLLCLLLLILGQLHAQGAGTTIIDFGAM